MKLSHYENPISGKEHNLFDLGSLWSAFLGIFVLIIVFVLGVKLAEKLFPPKPSTTAMPVTRIII